MLLEFGGLSRAPLDALGSSRTALDPAALWVLSALIGRLDAEGQGWARLHRLNHTLMSQNENKKKNSTDPPRFRVFLKNDKPSRITTSFGAGDSAPGPEKGVSAFMEA